MQLRLYGLSMDLTSEKRAIVIGVVMIQKLANIQITESIKKQG